MANQRLRILSDKEQRTTVQPPTTQPTKHARVTRIHHHRISTDLAVNQCYAPTTTTHNTNNYLVMFPWLLHMLISYHLNISDYMQPDIPYLCVVGFAFATS